MSRRRFLVLGGGEGWHANQLQEAAARADCQITMAPYESLVAHIDSPTAPIAAPGSVAPSDCLPNRQVLNQRGSDPNAICRVECEAGPLSDFDAILTRTMPAGSLEAVTFRLATLHSLDGPPLINPPGALEIAIDKYATLAHVAQLGFPVPRTTVVQSRADAMEAFERLGGDCVVKPIFGGEGRGVMRVSDPQLAWYTFSTLEQLGAIGYLQEFVAPGGIDTRMLVIGDQIIGLRRQNRHDFRTNVASGGECHAIALDAGQQSMAREIVASIGLTFASVDLLDCEDGQQRVLEVNGIPGWKGAQRVCDINIADQILRTLVGRADACQNNAACEMNVASQTDVTAK